MREAEPESPAGRGRSAIPSREGAGTKPERLDQALVARGLCPSREAARRLILAGEVSLNGRRVDKASVRVRPEERLEVRERPRFVSRGGEKLAGALAAFGIDPEGKICRDAGASTGGFTDCLLQGGAHRVYAFDVGTNQLAWKIRSDPRVVAREQFNIRHMQPGDLPEPVDLAVIDVSFISLTHILPPCLAALRPGGDLVCLIKPQFELERGEVGKGGVVRDEALRLRAAEKIRSFVERETRAKWLARIDCVLPGVNGNREWFAWIRAE